MRLRPLSIVLPLLTAAAALTLGLTGLRPTLAQDPPPAAAAAAAAPEKPQDAAVLLVGKPAPAFTLPDQNDKMRSLAENKGKWVVLAFYPKDMTGG
jgi:cytochrome oxidase Cu insertion factor (SCO1/SenC/PrrC family)